jgi:hypothetical protein
MEIGDIYGYFIRGPVRFVGQGPEYSKYSLVANGNIIDVHVAVHIRLIENLFGIYPDSFDIIAPMDAIVVMDGEIPADQIYYFPASEYLKLRLHHHGE